MYSLMDLTLKCTSKFKYLGLIIYSVPVTWELFLVCQPLWLMLSLLCGSQSETCRLLRQHAVSDIHAPPSTLLKTPFEKDFLQLYSWPQIKRTLLLYFIYLYIVVVMCVNVCVRVRVCVCG